MEKTFDCVTCGHDGVHTLSINTDTLIVRTEDTELQEINACYITDVEIYPSGLVFVGEGMIFLTKDQIKYLILLGAKEKS